MDNLCHTLAGAALGDAGLKRRTALGMSTLLIASNIPDIDVAVFATDTLPMFFRRGITHGVISMAILPALLAGCMLAAHRWIRWRHSPIERFKLREVLLLSYIGTWLHVFMDFLNSYGVRLLMPFSQRWFYGDALYIIDPLVYLFLGGAIVWGRLRKESPVSARGGYRASYGEVSPQRPIVSEHGREGGHGDTETRHGNTETRRRNELDRNEPSRKERAVRLGLISAAVYALLMLASNVWARAEVGQQLARAGRPNTRFMVTPVFGNPLRREVIVDLGERYEKGFLWFEPAPHFRPAGYGVPTNFDHPRAIAAMQQRRVHEYFVWSRFPFFQILETTTRGPRVILNDYRYAGPAGFGWSAMEIEGGQ